MKFEGMHKIVLLLSGGMDSVTLLHDRKNRGDEVHAMIVNYGQKNYHKETWCARHHAELLGVPTYSRIVDKLTGSFLTDESSSVVVPGRNSIFLSLAVSLAVSLDARDVMYAANKEDQADFPDCRHGFVQAYNALLRASLLPVTVSAPYIDHTKKQIADIAQKIGADLSLTWSCYFGRDKPCGECPACKKRAALNVRDVNPTGRASTRWHLCK